MRNSYYKVNKESGKEQKSYRTGDPIIAFKPNVTGLDFKVRKVCLIFMNPYFIRDTNPKNYSLIRIKNQGQPVPFQLQVRWHKMYHVSRRQITRNNHSV